MKKHWPVLVLFLCLVAACRKQQISLLTQEINSHCNYQLRDVFFVNDSVGYICGGDKWTIGVLLKTTDGGNTWSQPDSVFNACAYSMQFFSAAEGFIAGNVSDWAYTADSGKTFTASQSDYLGINQVAFINRQWGVRVSGDGYATGTIATTRDGGNTWQKTSLSNNMMAVSFADSNTAYAAGFGVIYKSTDAGLTFNPLDARGDFFTDISCPSANVAYFAGYEGLILKTTDGGQTFKKIHNGNVPFAKRIHFETIEFWDNNTGYAAGDAGYLLKTENGGDSWQVVTQFTSANLRSIHLFNPNAGIITGDEGKIFLFKQ